MTEERERADFEKAAFARYATVGSSKEHLLAKYDNGTYISHSINLAWWGWKTRAQHESDFINSVLV